MSELLFDTDLPTRMVQTFSMDDAERVTIRTQQDVAPILDYVDRMGKLNVTRDSKARKGTWRHGASIPMNIWDDLQSKMAAMNLSKDERQKFMKRWLNGEGSCWKFDKSFRL
jgi:hypothetical protein